MTELHTTRVDLSGLMRVLGEALYSTPQVALRELVQNAHDSIERRRLESQETFDARIDVRVDPENKTLEVRDTGAGLTVDEIHDYLATVGRGYTRELRDRGEGEGLIGYFGLGFLSAFVVASRVVVETTSHRVPGETHRFLSRSGETYSVTRVEPREPGTTVTLHLRDEHEGLADAGHITDLLARFAALVRIPVFGPGGARINAEEPPWRTDSSLSSLDSKRRALTFAARYDFEHEPLAVFPIVSDHASGVVYVRGGMSYATTDLRRVSTFVRGMFIGDEDRELLPTWAGFAGAIVESDGLRPTASRETLQRDETYARVSHDVSESLVRGLADAASRDRATFRRILLRHNDGLLGAAIDDPRLFELLAEEAVLPTTEGDLTVSRILERSGGAFHVSHDEKGGFELVLFRAQRVPVLLGSRFAVEAFARTYAERRRGRVDVLGSNDDTKLFRPATLDEVDEARLVAIFDTPDHAVLVRGFDPSTVPFVVVPDREAELKQRLEADAADRRVSRGVLALARSFTATIAARPTRRLYVNVENELVRGLLRVRGESAERVLGIVRPLLVLLSHSDVEADVAGALSALTSALTALLVEDR